MNIYLLLLFMFRDGDLYLGKLWLGEARLAHLRGLAHGDVALCQWPLGEGLGGPILTGLAVWSIALTGTLVT